MEFNNLWNKIYILCYFGIKPVLHRVIERRQSSKILGYMIHQHTVYNPSTTVYVCWCAWIAGFPTSDLYYNQPIGFVITGRQPLVALCKKGLHVAKKDKWINISSSNNTRFYWYKKLLIPFVKNIYSTGFIYTFISFMCTL